MKTHKGSILDIMFITFFIAAAMITIILGYLVFGTINAEMTTAGLNTTMLESSLTAIGNFDELMLFVYIGCGVACMISAFAVRTHPIFFISFLIIQILFIALTPMIQDTFNAVADNPEVSASAAEFPIFQQIIDLLPTSSLILSILVALVMFAMPG